MIKKSKKFGFTLIEVMVGILITTTIVIIGFQALNAIVVGKVKLIDSTTIEKETFFFTQKLFEEIKKGGTIDYEEYFNRKVVGNTSYLSGHYDLATGFGNFGNGGNVGTTNYGGGFYYCISPDGNQMGTGGCVSSNNSPSSDYSGQPQRYGQYSFQFIDYNVDSNNDLGDQDGDGNIRGDYDDEYIGNGPIVFSGGTDVKELYLLSADKTKRTLFRWNIKTDQYKPNTATCSSSGNSYTGSGCLGTIEFLRLVGKDWGMDHNSGSVDADGTQYDGVVDTWIIAPDFAGGAEIVAGSNNNNYWLPLFPDTINVAIFEAYLYPNKDRNHAWKDYSAQTNIAPYVRLKLKLMPSWKSKRKIKGKIPEFEINTTVNLTEIYSR